MNKNTLLTILIFPLIILYGDFFAWAVKSLVKKIFNNRVRKDRFFKWIGIHGINRMFIILLAVFAYIINVGYPIFWLILTAVMLVTLLDWKNGFSFTFTKGMKNEKTNGELK